MLFTRRTEALARPGGERAGQVPVLTLLEKNIQRHSARTGTCNVFITQARATRRVKAETAQTQNQTSG